MVSLLIKNVSPELHTRLKERAREHHRSLTQEAITLLEAGVGQETHRELPPLRKGKFPLTEAWVNQAKRAGRE